MTSRIVPSTTHLPQLGVHSSSSTLSRADPFPGRLLLYPAGARCVSLSGWDAFAAPT
jgi:hypothetical protein